MLAIFFSRLSRHKINHKPLLWVVKATVFMNKIHKNVAIVESCQNLLQTIQKRKVGVQSTKDYPDKQVRNMARKWGQKRVYNSLLNGVRQQRLQKGQTT